ncbi:MFS transporter [Clostridiaceae bacterium M8S5]|nr:MFS transporter [Clostridiaceae bacterium M8S5]
MGYTMKKNSVDNRNMILYLSGKFTSMFGTNVYAFAIGLYLLKLTGGMSFALNLALNTLPKLLLGPITGVISDKFDKKKIVVLTDLMSGLLLVGLFIFTFFSDLNPLPIYITTVLLTSFNTIFGITISSAIPTLVNEDNLIKINSYNSSVNSLSSILGPVAGGFIFGFLDIKYIILLNGISFVISAISECFIDFKAYINKVDDENKNTKISFIKDMKEVFSFLQSNKALFSIMIISPMLNFFFISVIIGFPFILVRQLSLSSKSFGIAEASYAIGMLVMALLFSRIKEIKKISMNLGFFIISTGFIAVFIGIPSLGVFSNFSKVFYSIYYYIVLFIYGATNVMINMPIQLIIQKKTPKEYLGRFYAIIRTMANIAIPIGAVLYGFLFDRVDSFILLFISGIIIVFMGIYVSKNKLLHNA